MPQEMVSIALAQNVLNGEQKPGTIVLRRDYSKLPDVWLCGGYGDLHWVLMRNYRCLDTYSDTQRVELLGLFVTVWAHGQRTSAHLSVVPGDNLALAIATTYLTAQQMCPHARATEVYHTIRGEHQYLCDDCGKTFYVDSSD